MPNVGSKKHVQPKKHKVQDVKAFAKGFVASVGDKNTAQTKALLMQKAALNGSIPDQGLANFWNNIAGVIGKL